MANYTLPPQSAMSRPYISLMQQGGNQNNPFCEETAAPFITHFLVCLCVTICQYSYKLWLKNENPRLAVGSKDAHFCTHVSTLHMQGTAVMDT